MRQKKYEDTYKDAYAYVSDYLKEKVIRNMEVVKLSTLVSIFKSKVNEIGVTISSPIYDPRYLRVSFFLYCNAFHNVSSVISFCRMWKSNQKPPVSWARVLSIKPCGSQHMNTTPVYDTGGLGFNSHTSG